jgi:hypothetical protein
MPHEPTCQTNHRYTDNKENGRIQSCESKRDQCLQDGEMNDIYSVREIAVFRKVSEITPEAKDEDNPRNPQDIEDTSCEPMVDEIQRCRDARNAPKVELECIEIQKEQYTRAEIGELRWKLRAQL